MKPTPNLTTKRSNKLQRNFIAASPYVVLLFVVGTLDMRFWSQDQSTAETQKNHTAHHKRYEPNTQREVQHIRNKGYALGKMAENYTEGYV
jgi:hypothetical protein